MVNTLFSYQIVADENTGGPIVTYGANNLPPGLNVNTGTGLIDGTPTQVMTRNVIIEATNAIPLTGQALFQLQITPPAPIGDIMVNGSFATWPNGPGPFVTDQSSFSDHWLIANPGSPHTDLTRHQMSTDTIGGDRPSTVWAAMIDIRGYLTSNDYFNMSYGWYDNQISRLLGKTWDVSFSIAADVPSTNQISIYFILVADVADYMNSRQDVAPAATHVVSDVWERVTVELPVPSTTSYPIDPTNNVYTLTFAFLADPVSGQPMQDHNKIYITDIEVREHV
jgi:hypothetical protein